MITKLENTYDNQKVLEHYLYDVDKDFEIPLSKKTTIDIYAIKLLTKGLVFVSIIDDQINGIIAGYSNNLKNGKAIITILSVRSDCRGLGISRQLIEKMIDYCRELGMRYIHVESVNPIAVASYMSSGFKIISVVTIDELTKTFLHYKL